MTYAGVIKAGYNCAEIGPRVDQAEKRIIFTMPKPKILDNYIDTGSVTYQNQDNIFNPIDDSETQAYLEQIKANELKAAEENGIYDQAREQAETILRNAFGDIADYEIVFE